jgi:hypothetical protein
LSLFCEGDPALHPRRRGRCLSVPGARFACAIFVDQTSQRMARSVGRPEV